MLNSLNYNSPLKLVGFWGVSDKKDVNRIDGNTIKFFDEYIKNIREVLGRKIEITWILADNHGKMNGYDELKYNKYLTGVDKLLKRNNYKTIYLSTLWKKWKISNQMILYELKNKKGGVA